MSYQEARRIRETRLKDLILRNVDQGQGALGAVGSALAERFNPSKRFAAKITGIKERLDPLNIAKKLTGNVGAALLGRAFGRSQEDIRYFSGKGRLGSYRGITQDNDLDNLLPAVYTKVSDGQRQRMKKGDSASDVLAKLYNLMKKNYENEEKRRELDINFKFKQEKQKEKWHKELLESIGSGGGTHKATPVKQKPKKKGLDFMSIITDAIESVKNFIMEKIDSIWKTLSNIFERLNLLDLAKGAVNLAKSVGGAVAGALEGAAGVAAAVPGLAAGLFLTPWVASAEERRKIEKNPNAPEYKDNPYAMKVRGEVKTENEGAVKNLRKGLKQYKRQEIVDAVESKIDDKELKEEYGAPRAELKVWLKDHPNPISIYQAPSEKTPNTLQRLGVEESTAGAGRGSATAARMDPRRVDLVKPDAGANTGGGASVGGMHGAKAIPMAAEPSSPAVPVSSTTMSEKVQSVIKENNNLQLEQMKPKVVSIDKSSKKIIPTAGPENKLVLDSSVDIRNDESTFNLASKQSIRVP